ncbi:nuclear transport factor 2 family protein [Hymenobacter sp. BRD128]|uniref:nuclear transport factor 2 family protein n=1 Tax=Hymenobacter sp. BRD128 TaxID=2675878 RepID=UPI001564D937|nr:nuclear transport factor 2 family protein [Hymenobacter sp. BRD128]QKG57080.1 nuclear transport factor 2 family protein [Hymenobacter sp. BRD128]
MKASLPLLAAATLLAFGAGSTSVPAAPRPAAAGPTTMAALYQQFADALQQQDMAKATACLAKNVRLLGTTSALSGRDSLSTYWLKDSFSTTTNLKLTPLRSGGDAMMGYTTGYFSADLKPTAAYPAGGSVRGSYMLQSHKQGTTWQISYVHVAQVPVKANK